jgi:hypothetical protein
VSGGTVAVAVAGFLTGGRLHQSERRIVVSARIFELSPQLIAGLRNVQERRGSDDITRQYDAFMLDPGMGPPTYLSSDGRIVWDDDLWGVIGTRAEAFAAIMVGVKKTGMVELRDLLPPRGPSSVDCAECLATGWFDWHGQLKDLASERVSFVCPQCATT